MNQSETNPLATALAALMTGHNANPNTSLRIPLVDSNGNLQPGPTLAELASVLGESQLYHRQPNTTMVVPKGINRQAIVFVAINGGDSVPSVFALSRTSVASAIMEGSVKTTDIEINSNGDLLLSGMSARHMYVRIFLME